MPAPKTYDAEKFAKLKLGTKVPAFAPEDKTWAEMLEGDQQGEETAAEATEKAVKDARSRLEAMIQQAAEEKGAEGVEGLLFAMGLAAENLATDFRDGRFAECPEVVEEDVFRLRRLVNEASEEVRAS